MEDGGSKEEADDDTSASHHTHDTDHGSWQTQCIEIDEVCCAQEDTDEYDRPVPVEWGGTVFLRPPDHEHHRSHEEELVDIVPALYNHSVQSYATILWGSHEIFVIKTADSSQYGSQDDEVDPLVMLEVDSFFLSAFAEHGERDDG